MSLENTITVSEIAAEMKLAEQTIRNSYLAQIKNNCDHWKIGKTIYVDKSHFNRFLDNRFKRKASPTV